MKYEFRELLMIGIGVVVLGTPMLVVFSIATFAMFSAMAGTR